MNHWIDHRAPAARAPARPRKRASDASPACHLVYIRPIIYSTWYVFASLPLYIYIYIYMLYYCMNVGRGNAPAARRQPYRAAEEGVRGARARARETSILVIIIVIIIIFIISVFYH